MVTFEFSTDVVRTIIDELLAACQFIRIAIFQLHNPEIFSVLSHQLKQGVRVEIFTLPFDSVHDKRQDRVTRLFKSLQASGATLYFCRWNVGDPERTSTAVGRWYSFHGKFIVTDRCAMGLSANFTDEQELDALIVFRNEAAKINEFNRKFDELIQLFISDDAGYEGMVRRNIIDTGGEEIESVFSLPKTITNQALQNHWIQHYPSRLCPVEAPISDKLYFTPFDCRGRHLFETLVTEATEFVYFSTESFTDADFAKFLKKVATLKQIDIRIITGITSMDFSDRIQGIFRDLFAHDIQLRTVEQSLHAKLLVTDKRLVVSSVNLNKMNLGFPKTKQYWRENTESITICSDPFVVSQAKSDYLRVFNQGIGVELKLAEKIQSSLRQTFSIFDLRSAQEVKSLFSRFVVKKEIEVKRGVLEIAKTTAKLAHHFNKKTVTKDEFLMALILYHLSERKQDLDQLRDGFRVLEDCTDLLPGLLFRLQTDQFIEKSGDFYKIKLDALNP